MTHDISDLADRIEQWMWERFRGKNGGLVEHAADLLSIDLDFACMSLVGVSSPESLSFGRIEGDMLSVAWILSVRLPFGGEETIARIHHNPNEVSAKKWFLTRASITDGEKSSGQFFTRGFEYLEECLESICSLIVDLVRGLVETK